MIGRLHRRLGRQDTNPLTSNLPPMPSDTGAGAGTQSTNPLGSPNANYVAPVFPSYGARVRGDNPAHVQGANTAAYGLPQLTPATAGVDPRLVGANAAGGTFYQAGAEWAPLSDPQMVQPLQAELVQAGLLNPVQMRKGVWDQTSASALATAMSIANSWGTDVGSALALLVQNPKPSSTSAGAPNAVASPLDTATAFQSAASSADLTGGMGIPPGQQQAFEQFYKQQELNAVTAGNRAAAAGQPTYQAAPSVSAAARQFILYNDPQQIRAFQTLKNAVDFESLLKGIETKPGP